MNVSIGGRARLFRSVALALLVSAVAAPGVAQISANLDPTLSATALQLTGQSQVVVTAGDGVSLDAVAYLIQTLGGSVVRQLPIINGQAALLPNSSLLALAGSGLVRHVALDRLIVGAMERTGITVGATAVRQDLGLDGSGVRIAVIDSGVAPGEDDLADPSLTGSQRIDRFADFVGGLEAPYDD